jgi:hypothetical protein
MRAVLTDEQHEAMNLNALAGARPFVRSTEAYC